MPFALISVDCVKSSNQSALVRQWDQLAVGRRLPALDGFAPPERDVKQLIVWDVEQGEAGRQFRMRKPARVLVENYGDFTGKTMDEVVPAPLRAFALEAANVCAETGTAIYAIITTVDAHSHRDDCERLLLPFGQDGVVTQIIAALQLISFEGTVERETIAHEFETRYSVSFTGCIAAGALDGRLGAAAQLANPDNRPTRAASPFPPPPDAAATPRASSAEHRQAPRRSVRKSGRIRGDRLNAICTVSNISHDGALLELAATDTVPDTFTLVLEMESAARTCSVAWRKDRQIGVRFT